jgi:putative phosphoribosyl transferase
MIRDIDAGLAQQVHVWGRDHHAVSRSGARRTPPGSALSGYYHGQRPLVLGIPRETVPMPRIIAEALEGELDVVLLYKLGAPGQPELAIGAVDEAGHLFLSDVRAHGVPEAYLVREQSPARQAIQLEMLHKRRAMYTPIRPPIDPAGRLVILVDNVAATGASMIAVLRTVHARHPAKLIAAMAVAPAAALKQMEVEADQVVCLEVPKCFYGVGQFLEDFSAGVRCRGHGLPAAGDRETCAPDLGSHPCAVSGRAWSVARYSGGTTSPSAEPPPTGRLALRLSASP